VLVTGDVAGESSNTGPGRAPRLILRPVDDAGDAFTLAVEGTQVDDGEGPSAYVGTYRRVDRPSMSESGGRIAFISNRSGNWEVYSMSPSGDDVRNLTSHEAGDHYPRWIAGGTRLSFRSQRSRDDGAWDRWEVDADGTDMAHVRIGERLANAEAGEFPEVHPTGAFVVNAVERDGEQDIRVWRRDGSGERVVAPAPGLDYRPLFSPDGSRIVFISERDGNAEIYTVDFDGSNVRRLTDAPGIDRYARWSPDGTRIGFVSDRDGDLEIYVMQADGTGLRQLTDNQSQDGEISWSPDGTRIAYRSDVDGDGEIHVVHVETREVVNLTQHEAYDGEPVWSPTPTDTPRPGAGMTASVSGG
jgi:Tol biopolymer transport system component